MLEETAMNNLNNHVLILRRHFVVGREAQAAPEDVRADVGAGPRDIGVASSSSVSDQFCPNTDQR